MFGRDDGKVKVSNAQISTFIGVDTTVEGKLITKSSLRIDGTVIGGVIAEGTVVLTESGQIQGNVMAENIIVSGVVDGNMEIKDKVNIEPTGEVYGDIVTNRILVDEHSVFQGQCNMNRDKEAEKKRRYVRTEEQLIYADDNADAEAKPKNKKTRSNAEFEIEELDEDIDLVTADDGDAE